MKSYTIYFTIFIIFLVSLFSFSFDKTAYASINPYIALKLGYSHYLPITLKEASDNGRVTSKKADTFAIGGAVGASFRILQPLAIRTELEYIYRLPKHTELQSIAPGLDIETQTLLANVYIDYYVLPALNIYVGAGIGFSALNLDIPHYLPLPTQCRFAAQGGVGMQYILLEHFVFDLNVRYVYLGEWKKTIQEVVIKGEPSTVEVMFSFAYKF